MIFQPAMNFMRLSGEHSSPDSYFYIMQFPYDATTSFMPGTRTGPAAIINASSNLELYDMDIDSETWKKGIHTMPAVETHSGSPEMMHERIYKAVSGVPHPKDHFIISLGGEHSVSYGAVRAHKEIYGDIIVVHFDAHADLRDEYEGCRFSHASVMRRIYEDLDCEIVQIGIRSMDIEEKEYLCDCDGITSLSACSLADDEEMARTLLREKIKGKKVYISFDIDVFDSSIIWKTGTPEPGGLDWFQINRMLRYIYRMGEVVGADVVELIGGEPANDSLVAKLVYRMMGYKIV